MDFGDFYFFGLFLQPTVYGMKWRGENPAYHQPRAGQMRGFWGSVCVLGGGGGMRTAQRRLLNHICNRYTNVPVYSLTPPVYI